MRRSTVDDVITKKSLVRIGKLALALLAALVISTPAAAVVVNLEALMDGAQANGGAGTGSLGTGTGAITFDTDSNLLSWNVTWSGLTGTPSAMHFHGPAAPGVNAGVQLGIGVAGPPVAGSATITAGQETDLLAGLWYLNLHTSAFGGGEIRGQVLTAAAVPGPGMLLAIPMAFFGLRIGKPRMAAIPA